MQSPGYISTLFKKEIGKTLTDYIHEKKIREACYLLETTNLPLIELSEKLAFSSQQQFQKIFKQVTGNTPGSWSRSGLNAINNLTS